MPSTISGSQISAANLLIGGTYLSDTISTINSKVSNNYLQAQSYGDVSNNYLQAQGYGIGDVSNTYLQAQSYGNVSNNYLQAQSYGDVSNNYLQAAFSSGYRAGELIETITGNCRGEVVEVLSGTYTLQNVTSAMSGSTTYTAITGSTLNYTPPSGTKRVLYRFDYKFDVAENSGISHHVLYIDGVKVDPTTTTISSNYASTNWHHANFMVSFSFVIQCDAAADNASEGQFTSWTSSKELKVMYREYNASYESSIHSNVWWDGTGASGTDNFRSPTLTIQAYA